MSQELIDKAMEFARKKHQGQEYDSMPFIIHPMQTYDLLSLLTPRDHNLLAAALLHDTLEDTATDYTELAETFNHDVADLVLEVTETGPNVFPRLSTQRGVMLKFADRLSNLSNMHEWDEERKKKYLRKSRFWKVR